MTYDDGPDFNQESEVLSPAVTEDALALITKGEIDAAISTAKKYRRADLSVLRKKGIEMVTADPQTADECIYALPRAGKTIEGPSARFAEILAYTWGNNRSGARPISEDSEFIVAQGVFHDLETNISVTVEVKRRITDSKGRRYNSDMVGTTANAANSIARRNAILGGIPKSLWLPIYDAARKVVAGDVRTLANRRAEAIKAFAKFGITPEKIFATLEVSGVDDITGDHLVTLRGILTAIREGEVAPEQAFAPKDSQDQVLADKSATGVQKIKDRYSKTPEAQPRVEPGTQATETVAAPSAPEPAPQAALVTETVHEIVEDFLPTDDVVSRCAKHGDYPGEGNCPQCENEAKGEPGLFKAEELVEKQQAAARARQPRPRHRDDG